MPPNVGEELGSDHLCFFVRQVVRQLDLSVFEKITAERVGCCTRRS